MLKTVLVACVLALSAFSGLVVHNAKSQVVVGATFSNQVSASSGTVAAGAATATIPAVAGATNFLCGFAITSTGSTAAAVVAPTVVGLNGGTETFAYASVAGATLANLPLIVNYNGCVPASGPNVAIVVSLPSLGAGSTNATVNAWGYRVGG